VYDYSKVRHVVDLVGRLLGDDRVARHIPDYEIDSLRKLAESNKSLNPEERLVKGVAIMIAGGPLKGVRGIVLDSSPGKRKLVVQIELLGRGVSTELSADDVVEHIRHQ